MSHIFGPARVVVIDSSGIRDTEFFDAAREGKTVDEMIAMGYKPSEITYYAHQGRIRLEADRKLEYDSRFRMWFDPRTDHLDRVKECWGLFGAADIRRDDIVMDLGAHIGGFAVIATRMRGARVVAYEPAPDTFDFLRMNTDQDVRQVAVCADDSKTVDLYISRNHMGTGSCTPTLIPLRNRDKVSVPAIRFEAALAEIQPQVLKIDVEGLETSYNYLNLPESLRCVLLEIHFFRTKGSADIDRVCEIIAQMEAQNFEVYHGPWWCLGYGSDGIAAAIRDELARGRKWTSQFYLRRRS